MRKIETGGATSSQIRTNDCPLSFYLVVCSTLSLYTFLPETAVHFYVNKDIGVPKVLMQGKLIAVVYTLRTY